MVGWHATALDHLNYATPGGKPLAQFRYVEIQARGVREISTEGEGLRLRLRPSPVPQDPQGWSISVKNLWVICVKSDKQGPA
jgi:hypothetical protein